MTLLSSLFDMRLFHAMVEGKYVRVKQHPTEQLWIGNYAEKTVYEKVWNDVTLQCRGLIWNDQGKIVARPFKKFFNVGEYGPEFVWPDGPVIATDKMDGSLGILYRQPSNGQMAIATRGSFQSDQAIKATEIFREKHWRFRPHEDETYLFEILYPANRIVIDYGNAEDVYLLGTVNIASGKVVGPTVISEWAGPAAVTFGTASMSDMMLMKPRPNAEGLVLRFESGLMVKLKQEDYVRAHAIITGCTNRSIWAALSKGEDLPEKASFMPDEFHDWMKLTACELDSGMRQWRDDALVEFRRVFRTVGQTRKEFAEIASQSPLRAALFKLYDGQSIDDLAWKAVRPAEIVRPFAQSEDSN